MLVALGTIVFVNIAAYLVLHARLDGTLPKMESASTLDLHDSQVHGTSAKVHAPGRAMVEADPTKMDRQGTAVTTKAGNSISSAAGKVSEGGQPLESLDPRSEAALSKDQEPSSSDPPTPPVSAFKNEEIAAALGNVIHALNMKRKARAAGGATVKVPVDTTKYPLKEVAANQTDCE